MRWLRNDFGRIILLISIIMISNVMTFTIPNVKHLRVRKTIASSPTTYYGTTNEFDEIQNHNNNEIQPEDNFTSSKEILSDDGVNRDWLIPDFLEKILPLTSFFSSSRPEETGNQNAPNNNSRSIPSSILSRLFPNIIIGRPSIFRIQFYNSDFEDSSSPDDDNSTGPNAVFGSPLCLGLCVPVQVFSENTSIHLLSDKQFSLFPAAPNPTPLVTATESGNSNLNSSEQQQLFNVNASTIPALGNHQTDEDGTLGWLSSWIPTAPTLSKIQNNLQLSEFPKLSTGVTDFIIG